MKVVLYSTGCPKCNVLKKKLEEGKINYEVCQSVEKMLNMGINEVPVLGVDDKLLSFGEAVKWVGRR